MIELTDIGKEGRRMRECVQCNCGFFRENEGVVRLGCIITMSSPVPSSLRRKHPCSDQSQARRRECTGKECNVSNNVCMKHKSEKEGTKVIYIYIYIQAAIKLKFKTRARPEKQKKNKIMKTKNELQFSPFSHL